MANTKESERNGIYLIEGEGAETWEIKSEKKLKRFWKWIQKKKIMPGDIIPKKILKRYYKRLDNE